jgi:hypothetical protein
MATRPGRRSDCGGASDASAPGMGCFNPVSRSGWRRIPEPCPETARLPKQPLRLSLNMGRLPVSVKGGRAPKRCFSGQSRACSGCSNTLHDQGPRFSVLRRSLIKLLARVAKPGEQFAFAQNNSDCSHGEPLNLGHIWLFQSDSFQGQCRTRPLLAKSTLRRRSVLAAPSVAFRRTEI